MGELFGFSKAAIATASQVTHKTKMAIGEI